MEGVFQKILSIDLNRGLIGEERLPETWYRTFLGGLGVGMQYLLEDLGSQKPFLDDPILLMTGPLTGHPLPGSSKASWISYRKDSGQLKLGSVEGKFPAYVKLAGFDGLVITGRAREPVRLHLSAKRSQIFDASPIWGEDVFSLDKGRAGNGQEGSILAIGPAGEKGHPFATIISDGWIPGGAGIGQDFGVKGLKLILIEPDGELEQNPEARGFPSWITSYLEKHLGRVGTGEIRRSCFGCVKCCGRYDPQDDLLFLEEDVERLQTLIPEGSIQGSKQNLRLFYRECLRQGLDPFRTAESILPLTIQNNVEQTLKAFMTQPRNDREDCVNTRSWEEAQLYLQGWYRDEAVRNSETLADLIDRENWAMVKNCLPVCERWEMAPEEMVFFLNRVTGSDYSQEDLFKIGKNLTDQAMRLYQSLHYSPVDPEGIRPCHRHLPSVFKVQLGNYLKDRKWEKTGFPEKT